MTKDWTDIIGEQLESIREPLPADDWKVLQQRYAASRRKKRIAAFAWIGGIVSAAAMVILALLLAKPLAPSAQEKLVAESIPVEKPVQQSHIPDKFSSTNEETDNSSEDIVSSTEDASSSSTDGESYSTEGENSSVEDVSIADSATPGGNVAAYTQSDAVKEKNSIKDERKEAVKDESKKIVEILKDTTSAAERLVAEAKYPGKETEMTESAWDFEQLPEEKGDKEPGRRRNPISIGVTGGVSEKFAFGFASAYHDAYDPPMNTVPADTLVQQKHMSYTKSRVSSEYYDSYSHEIPVSVGVSARYFLSRRFAVNTGLVYTRYTSTRNRYLLWTGEKISTDKQNVHYLGVPVRLDLMIVNRTHFNLYLGGGINIDKCIYASVGKERLREKEVVLSSVFTAGFQVNVVPSFGLYFEPYVSRILMKGTLPTGRDELMISAQGGLRFNF
jgi:hypothetical protein